MQIINNTTILSGQDMAKIEIKRCEIPNCQELAEERMIFDEGEPMELCQNHREQMEKVYQE